MDNDKMILKIIDFGDLTGKRDRNRGTFDENYICKTVKKREKGEREKKD